MNASKRLLTISLGISVACAALYSNAPYRMPRDNHKRTMAEKKKKEEIVTDSNSFEFAEKKRAKRSKGKKEKARVFSEMTLAELKEARKKQQEAKNTEAVLKYTERMLRLAEDFEEGSALMLEYAGMLYDNGNIKKAGGLYSQFAELYPGNPHIEEALYKAVVCSFYNTLSFDRDQTETQNTITLADKFLGYSTFAQYRKQVLDIRLQCYQRIIQSELNVCDYYLKNKQPKAITKRLEHVRSKWLAKVPEYESQVLSYEIRLAELEGNVGKRTELQEKHAALNSSLITAQADSLKHARDRF